MTKIYRLNHYINIVNIVVRYFLPAPAKSIDKYGNAYLIQIGAGNGR